MQFEMLYAKIHRARVSDANLNYVGSITIDRALCEAAGLCEGMKVDVLDINNGERFSTYVIVGDKAGEVCVNGAAARKVAIDDIIIIIAYAHMDATEARAHKPKVVLVDENNRIKPH
ncbi:aspartate 1-decarboxylase [Helicobacter sp. CLO-3]|uniref:aspartate 1-decarboxylase n=1 Tax=unclassified Helicobacter TaxID=2593540 RepID=UPI000804F229|nr:MULTISPECIES: aspartate 1-decarboxylase [unclassified Helicobacter]OBV29236.1 aspartate 1-decarboxylase [Helicobacter sp. CLO-3]OHU83904.1 aspartate 1-decarboxylase [Helicobacter sp. CLO-3]